MAEQGGELGRAYIRVDADLSPLDAKLEQVKAKAAATVAEANAIAAQAATGAYGVEGNSGAYSIAGEAQINEAKRVADELQGSYNRAFGEIANDADAAYAKVQASATNAWQGTATAGQVAADEIGTSFKKSVSAVTSLLGRVTAVIGTIVGAYQVGRAIREYFSDPFEKAAENAEKFAQSLDFTDSTGSLTSVNAKVAELSSNLAELSERNAAERFAGKLLGITPESVQAELDAARDLQNQLTAATTEGRAKREKEEADAAKAAAAAKLEANKETIRGLAEQYKDLIAENMSEEDRINFDYDRQIGAVERGISASTKAEREARLALIAELERARDQSIERSRRKQTEEGEAALMDSIAREAAAREAMASQVAQKTAALFQQAFTVTDSSLERIEVGINRLIEVIQLREGQGL